MTTELVIAFLTGPVFIGAIAAIWYYFTQVREPARIKERVVSSASEREQINSIRAFGEATESRSQSAINDTQEKLVAFLLASNDGKISEILNEIKAGSVSTASLIIQGNAEKGEQGRLIIASQNQLISLLSRFLEELPALKHVEDYSIGLQIQQASIESAAVQQVKAVVAAAVATETKIASVTIEGSAPLTITEKGKDNV